MTATPTGPEIRKARLEHELSILALAQRAGVAWRTLRDLEAGKPVRSHTLRKVVEALAATPTLRKVMDQIAKPDVTTAP